ncbi:MAG TPA: hypothetical protein VLB00_02100, partial [Gemmatimonadales bacterium]|nr:hypothetical protein [Gemmatimonadales bacterium]
ALGGPADSLLELESRVADGISTGVESSRRLAARQEWLGRALTQVALEVKSPTLSSLAGTGDYLIDAEVAHAAGDTVSALRLLRRAEASRVGLLSSDLTFEAILPEARLLASMGDLTGAIGRLNPTLSDLRHVSLQLVSNPVGAALLVRAMAFRADLAHAAGDTTTARQWGRTVHTLWSGSDPFLAPVVLRMQRLARGIFP